jgi:flagellar motor switch protein FliG
MMNGLGKLLEMKDKEIQDWLMKVDANKDVKTLMTALAGADEAVREKVFANMTPRAGAALKEGIKTLQAGALKDEEIRAAVGKMERML